MRAELCTRLAATGLPRVEAASFVHPKLRAADGRRGGGVRGAAATTATIYAASCSTARGSTARSPTARSEIHVAYPVTDTFAQRNQNTTVEAGARASAEEIVAARTRRVKATVTLVGRVRLPVRGPTSTPAW